MPIVIVSAEDMLTIENTDTQEEITFIELSSGEFEIDVSKDRGSKLRVETLTREQMKEVRDWIVERLK